MIQWSEINGDCFKEISLSSLSLCKFKHFFRHHNFHHHELIIKKTAFLSSILIAHLIANKTHTHITKVYFIIKYYCH